MYLGSLVGYVLFALQIAVLATTVYAFVHAAMQRPDAYTAVDKLTKPVWLAILGGGAVLGWIIGPPVRLRFPAPPSFRPAPEPQAVPRSAMSAYTAGNDALQQLAQDADGLDFARIRLEQAIIGIVVAMIVQALVFPPRAHRKVRLELAGVYRDMALVMGHITTALQQQPFATETVRSERLDARSRLSLVDEMWDDAMSEHPSHSQLAAHWRVTTRRIWEQCAVLATEVAAVTESELIASCRDDLTGLTQAIEASLSEISRWFRNHRADDPLSLPDIDRTRRSVLRRVRAAEAHEQPESYSETLQVLAVANACNMIAVRLLDLSTQHDDAVRIHGPMD